MKIYVLFHNHCDIIYRDLVLHLYFHTDLGVGVNFTAIVVNILITVARIHVGMQRAVEMFLSIQM